MSRLLKLRESMKKYNINYYIIPSSDPHQSEYVAEYYTGRAADFRFYWISRNIISWRK